PATGPPLIHWGAVMTSGSVKATASHIDMTQQQTKTVHAERPERPRKDKRFAMTLSLPPLLWQLAFFVGPLLVLVAMSFWSVKMFRLSPDFILGNWAHLLNAQFFRDAYLYTLVIALIAAILASLVSLPVSYALARKVSPNVQRIVVFLLIITFFTSYPVRIYAWQIVLSPDGILNGLLGALGLGSVEILNTTFATTIGFLTLVLPLVILIQTFAFATV